MGVLKIKNAINHYNDNVKGDNEPKLTQNVLGSYVMEDQTEDIAGQYISNWSNDKRLSKLKPEHIIKICEITGVDPNFLYNYEPTK